MQEAKKKRLRDAWHGPLTLGQIARSAALGERRLQRFWEAEKAAGRLPAGPRPHFVERSKRDEAPAEVLGDEVTSLNADDTPIGEPNRVCTAESEALLAAMRRQHAELDCAKAQTVPLSWLRFDRKGMPTPTHAMLMVMCRMLDAAALISPLRFRCSGKAS